MIGLESANVYWMANLVSKSFTTFLAIFTRKYCHLAFADTVNSWAIWRHDFQLLPSSSITNMEAVNRLSTDTPVTIL